MKKLLCLLVSLFISASVFAGDLDIPERIEDFSQYVDTIEKLYKTYSDIEKVEVLSCYKYKYTMSAVNDVSADSEKYFESRDYDSWLIPDYVEEPFTLLFIIRLTGTNEDGSEFITRTSCIITFEHFKECIWY